MGANGRGAFTIIGRKTCLAFAVSAPFKAKMGLPANKVLAGDPAALPSFDFSFSIPGKQFCPTLLAEEYAKIARAGTLG